MSSFFTSVAAISAFLFSMVPATLLASPYSLAIEGVSFKGTACPDTLPSAVKAIYDANLQKIIVTMPRAEILVEPGVSLSKSRSNCAMTLRIRPTPGTQFAITSHFFDGVVQMDGGVLTELAMISWFSSLPRANRTSTKMYGPTLSVLAASREMPDAEQYWSGCGSIHELNIQLSMRMVAIQKDTQYPTGSFYTRSSSGPKLGVEFRGC